ncbi:guanylate-binding protein 4 [Dorcoceras hygrometricum]|uniref:Guanylate-binding protein 4 n=1 Tax=Dorcoceras hygrometricum TaxID=472368 RepID=A0A2Z7CXT0_9LAMI|nr:guanylate-binding protein 4 [Dorcoceras hygrometricum]
MILNNNLAIFTVFLVEITIIFRLLPVEWRGGSWKSNFLYVRDRGWGVPTTWSSGLSKIKIGGTHYALQLECGSLGLFDETIDPRLLLPAGKKIDLAEVRALQNGAGRRPKKAPWVRPPRRRVGPDSRDAPRRMGSPRSTDRRSSPQPRQLLVGDENLKRSREVEKGAPHNVSGGGHLFVEGVNCRDRAGSFWDMSDPDLGWNMGKTLIGDNDVLHLLPQPTESLTHALAWNACQVLSLASTFQLREEKSRNSESKLHEEIAMLREELLNKQKESHEKSKSCETLHVELEEKSKSYDVLRQELQQLEEKYSVELTTGEHFLNSALGKTLLMRTGEKAVEGYRASSAFRDEVLQQALTIPVSVPEPGDKSNEELLGTLDEILDDIDDDEMIEALRQNPI